MYTCEDLVPDEGKIGIILNGRKNMIKRSVGQ